MLTRCGRAVMIGVLLAAASAGAQQSVPPRYHRYETNARAISEMEWGLLQVNVRCAPQQVEVSFDTASHRFRADTWVLPADLGQLPKNTLQERMHGKVNLVRVLLGRWFPEFREASGHDLKMQFMLAEPQNTVIAVWEEGALTFSAAYHEALKRSGRR
jgi:hypothetical protein